MAFGAGDARITRLFPNINHPEYVPSGPRSGFGWPNLIAWWESGMMTFEQPAVPFSLLVSLSGSVMAATSGEEYAVDAGCYLAIPPGSDLTVLAVRPDAGHGVSRWFAAFFNPVFVRNVWESDEARFHPLPRLYAADELRTLLADAVLGFLSAPNDVSVSDEDIEDLFQAVIQGLAPRDEADRERWKRLVARDEEDGRRLLSQLNRARDLADTQFSTPITVDQMAERAAVSKYHFIRLFQRAFGQTPHQYLLTRRLEHAAERLREGARSISDLREECGFASLGSFSWAFKRAYGVSPSQFAIPEKSARGREQYDSRGGTDD